MLKKLRAMALIGLVVLGCMPRRTAEPVQGAGLSSVTIGRWDPGDGPKWESMTIGFKDATSGKTLINQSFRESDFSAGAGGSAAAQTLKVPYGSYNVLLQYFDGKRALVYQSCEDDEKKVHPINQPTVGLTVAICDVKGKPTGEVVAPTEADVTITPQKRAGGAVAASAVSALSVKGGKLVNQKGETVILRGISSHGLQWYGHYANEAALKWLRDDWKINVFRAVMYTDPSNNGYIENRGLADKVREVVDASVKLGLYVIIDWHILNDGNPNQYKRESIEFFTDMAKRYKDTPNVLFEIANEPNGDVQWVRDIKPYSEEVVKAIRGQGAKNIVILGSSTWSQDVDQAAGSPLTGENLMYALHFYTGTHKQELRDKAKVAIDKGVALFATGWGVSESSGGGGVHLAEADLWLSFLKAHQISWVSWGLSDKNESSALLNSGADQKGNWTDANLSEGGKYIRTAIREGK